MAGPKSSWPRCGLGAVFRRKEDLNHGLTRMATDKPGRSGCAGQTAEFHIKDHSVRDTRPYSTDNDFQRISSHALYCVVLDIQGFNRADVDSAVQGDSCEVCGSEGVGQSQSELS